MTSWMQQGNHAEAAVVIGSPEHWYFGYIIRNLEARDDINRALIRR